MRRIGDLLPDMGPITPVAAGEHVRTVGWPPTDHVYGTMESSPGIPSAELWSWTMTAGDGSVVIRDALASDAPTLSFLLGQLGFPCPTGEIVGRLQGMPGAALVAVRDGQVVGLVTTNIMPVLHRPTPVGRLSALIVTTQERRRGVGRALVAAAERMLKKQGCELVEVTSNLRLEDAHSFYQRLGYEVTSLRFRKALDGTPQDAPAHEPPARPVG